MVTTFCLEHDAQHYGIQLFLIYTSYNTLFTLIFNCISKAKQRYLISITKLGKNICYVYKMIKYLKHNTFSSGESRSCWETLAFSNTQIISCKQTNKQKQNKGLLNGIFQLISYVWIVPSHVFTKLFFCFRNFTFWLQKALQLLLICIINSFFFHHFLHNFHYHNNYYQQYNFQ
jgi:hypothetical protein